MLSGLRKPGSSLPAKLDRIGEDDWMSHEVDQFLNEQRSRLAGIETHRTPLP